MKVSTWLNPSACATKTAIGGMKTRRARSTGTRYRRFLPIALKCSVPPSVMMAIGVAREESLLTGFRMQVGTGM